MEKDDRGRIIQIDVEEHVGLGHSVCNNCGKDMPKIWDTVCHLCRKTLCYNCSLSDGFYWYCPKHVRIDYGG